MTSQTDVLSRTPVRSDGARCPRLFAAALSGLLLAGAPLAEAQIDPYKQVPLYRAFVFGGIDRDGDGGFATGDFDIIDYASNTTLMPFAHMNRSFSANGAALNYTGWAAHSGFYATRAYASMTVNNAAATDGYYLVAGQGTTTSSIFYSPEAQSARAVFTFRISGTENNPQGIGRSTSRVDFAASTDPNQSWVDLFNGGLTGLSQFGRGTFTYTVPIAQMEQQINYYFWSAAFTEVRRGDVAQGANFTITADYGNTFVLDEVQLFNDNNIPLSSWEMEDVDGNLIFNQTGRVAAILPSPIPEPGSWALMLGGLALLGQWARRRKAARLR